MWNCLLIISGCCLSGQKYTVGYMCLLYIENSGGLYLHDTDKWNISYHEFSHSVVSSSLRPHGLQHTRLPITNSRGLLKSLSIELVMPSNHLISVNEQSSMIVATREGELMRPNETQEGKNTYHLAVIR